MSVIIDNPEAKAYFVLSLVALGGITLLFLGLALKACAARRNDRSGFKGPFMHAYEKDASITVDGEIRYRDSEDNTPMEVAEPHFEPKQTDYHFDPKRPPLQPMRWDTHYKEPEPGETYLGHSGLIKDFKGTIRFDPPEGSPEPFISPVNDQPWIPPLIMVKPSGSQEPINESLVKALEQFQNGRTVAIPGSLEYERVAGELKTWPEYFQAQLDGLKPWELRLNDRDFKVGQLWLLREYQPDYTGVDEEGKPEWGQTGSYSGRWLMIRIQYLMTGPKFGLEAGWVIFTYETVSRRDKNFWPEEV